MTLENANITADIDVDIDDDSDTVVMGLIGTLVFDATDDLSEEGIEKSVKIDFTDENSGTFSIQTGSDFYQPLFEFSFEKSVVDIRPEYGHLVSTGQWYGSDDSWTLSDKPTGNYQFIVASKGSFVVSVYSNNGIQSWTFSKTIIIPPRTFLQKYGMGISMVAMFFVNKWMMNKLAPPHAQPQSGAPAAANGESASSASATSGDKKSK